MLLFNACKILTTLEVEMQLVSRAEKQPRTIINQTVLGKKACPITNPTPVQCRHCVSKKCELTGADFEIHDLPQRKITIPKCPHCQSTQRVLALSHSFYETIEPVDPNYLFYCLDCHENFN